MEFMGYVRPDGKVGARNYVAVIPSVTCANDVANAICHLIEHEAERKAFGKSAKENVKRYSPQNIMPQWEMLFHKLTEK